MKMKKYDDVNFLNVFGHYITRKGKSLCLHLMSLNTTWDRPPKWLREILCVGGSCSFDHWSLYFWGCSLIRAAKLNCWFKKLFSTQHPHSLWAKFCLRGLRFSICQSKYPRRTHGKKCGCSDTKMGHPALQNQCLLQRPSLNIQGSHFDILSYFMFDITKWNIIKMI